MRLLDRFVHFAPALRYSKANAVGRVTHKAFVKDAGFGDCPMQIVYEFADTTGRVFKGRHVGTESSYYNLRIGDHILIRYLESEPEKSAPRDALGIISPVQVNE